MKILAIDTATVSSSIAIGDERGVVATIELPQGSKHAENLVPLIKELCSVHEFGLKEFAAVAVDVGPGLFTGLRVGISTAKALGLALAIQVVPVSSLEVLFAGLNEMSDRAAVGAVDARRGEVFAASCDPPFGPRRRIEITGPDLETPELLARRIEIKLESGKVQLLGDGITRYQEELTGQPVIRDAIAAGELVLRGAEHRHPSSSVLLQIALNVFNSGGGIDPVKLEPLYLRKADVKIGWETRFAGKPVLGGEVE